MSQRIHTLDEEIEDAIVNNLGDRKRTEEGEDTMATTVKVLRGIIARERELGYRKGWQKGRSDAIKNTRKRLEKLKEPSELPRHLFTKDEITQQDYGYMCAKNDIKEGLQ